MFLALPYSTNLLNSGKRTLSGIKNAYIKKVLRYALRMRNGIILLLSTLVCSVLFLFLVC